MALPSPRREPNLGLVISNAILAKLLDVHTCITAKVERYYGEAGHHFVDVKPMVRSLHLDEEAQRVADSIPVIPGVPLLFPGAGGMRITFPVNPGDEVLLVVSESSLENWKERGSEVDPGDDRRHNWSDAVAIPGATSKPGAWTGASTTAITIGQDGGPFQGAALGETLKSYLDALKATFDSHTHVSSAPGAPTAVPLPLSPAVPTVASATVKVSG